METTAEFKKGDKVTYLGYEGVITNVSTDVRGRYFYSVAYNNGNGRTKASNIYNNSQVIK